MAKISQKFELEFLQDMQSLGVLPADSMPRVTEYISQIQEFINSLIVKNFAYESHGSVYFDTQKYTESGFSYPKFIKPQDQSLKALLQEGEGALTVNSEVSEKLDGKDFVLWKKSKDGEPYWDSQWGRGRPGWHIECSAMIHSVFGEQGIDIHAGGEDLKFPHHDNEIAQSQAHYGCDQVGP